mgnify:FL=1
MQFSEFGAKFTGQSGIVELMEDLGEALTINPDMIFMGGGNPARIPAAEAVFQSHFKKMVADPVEFNRLIGIYQSPKGDPSFCHDLADYLNRSQGWNLSANNIAIANGSQSAFFIIANMLAGRSEQGNKTLHLPLSPEYLGYADSGLSQTFFTATKPSIELLEEQLFKYHVDFNHLNLPETTNALCVSRPTNPTGNVLSDEELEHLSDIAVSHNIPFIIDGAYGVPFPDINFVAATPRWDNNTILMLSLSKLGLPGIRGGIVIANEAFIQAFTNANTIISLACSTVGPMLAQSLIRSGDLEHLTQNIVKPYYQDSAAHITATLHRELKGLPYRIHKPEGAIFVWVWFEDLPISSRELYERCKAQGLLVVPGENFFIGIEDDWAHKHQCLRISHAQSKSVIDQGIAILAKEARALYQ